ncbi:hypothetical protein [Streptomyces sp. NPDC015131]|uniref:hypothetical protein n=1 Tax=Streptomyces sp. NPDC015131 TaxID=3364941 RepID=UPI0036FA175C
MNEGTHDHHPHHHQERRDPDEESAGAYEAAHSDAYPTGPYDAAHDAAHDGVLADERGDDAPPRRGRVVLMAVLVPLVGAAGSAAGPLFRGVSSAGGPLLVVVGAVLFLAVFALTSLTAIWLLNKASVACARVRDGFDRRSGRED